MGWGLEQGGGRARRCRWGRVGRPECACGGCALGVGWVHGGRDCVGVMGGGSMFTHCGQLPRACHGCHASQAADGRMRLPWPPPPCQPLPSLHAPFIPPTPIHPPTTRPAVAAGVPQRMLLDWLAEYRYAKNPSGWILPAQSWFIDQVRQSTPASTLLLLLNGPIVAH